MATAILGFNRKKLKTEIVDQLPEEGKSGTIYFVPNNIEDEDNNKYDEYIWLKDTKEWELIGVSEIDLENYVTKEALELTNTALFQEPVININQITNNTGGEGDGTRWRVPYAVTKAFQWVNEDPTRQQWYFRPGLKIIFRASDVRDNNGFTGPFITFQYSLIDFSEVNFCNDSNWVRAITEAEHLVSRMYHTENGRKYSGEKFDMHKAKEVCERYRGILPTSVTAADVYVAINSQYHDYVELFKNWFGNDIEQRVIESAIVFWFKDADSKSENKVVGYFREH